MDRTFTTAEVRFLRAVAAGKVEHAPGARGGQRYYRWDSGQERDAGPMFRRFAPEYVVSGGPARGSGVVVLTDAGRAELAKHPEES